MEASEEATFKEEALKEVDFGCRVGEGVEEEGSDERSWEQLQGFEKGVQDTGTGVGAGGCKHRERRLRGWWR